MSDPRESEHALEDAKFPAVAPRRVSDPRELAAKVRQAVEGAMVGDYGREAALTALDALVAQAEGNRKRADVNWNRAEHFKALNEQHTEECAALERERDRQFLRARRYEYALREIDNTAGWESLGSKQRLAAIRIVVDHALTEEQNTVGGGQAGC